MEEWVFLYSRRASLNVAESMRAVDGAELADYVFCLGRNGWFGGEVDRFGDNSRTISFEEGPEPKKTRGKERGRTVYRFL